MKKLKAIVLVCFTFILMVGNAQNAEWINQIGSSGPDSVEDIVIDDDGNIYVTGNYSDGANFGNGIILQSSGQQDIFAAKYNSSGGLIWLFSSGGVFGDAASGIYVDDQGYTYITGYTNDNEGVNFLIIKIDTEGNFVWEVTELIEGFGSGNNIAVDGLGNVYVSGNFSETIYFNDGASSTTEFNTPDNRPDIFLAKYNSSGAFQWADQEGGFGDDYGIGIAATSDGTIFMSGSFDNSAYGFQGNDDAFVASYNSSGSINWARQYGGNNRQMLVDIALGNDNSLYTVGTSGPVNSLFDGVVRKYNQLSGQLQWTDIISEVELTSIFVYPNNNYFVAGLTDNGTLSDFFLAKYITNNQAEWQYVFGGNSENVIRGIAGDANGNAYIVGRFNGSFTEGGDTYNSAGSTDGIVAQILPTDYCLSSSISTQFGYISNVEFNTSANSSSTCDSYTNHNLTIAEIYPAMTTFFEVTLASCGGSFNKGFKIFIDWNQDGDFTDSGEEVFVSGIITNETVTGSFIAPNNFTTGLATTVRIVCMNMIGDDPAQDSPTDISPCGEYFFGETEDYKVSLVDNMPPNITGFTPEQGYLGDQVTIDGDFFDPTTIDSVQFNMTNASFAVVDNNTIIAVPNIGSTTGLISIYYDGGAVVSSTQSFDLLCTEEFTGFEDQNLPNGWLLFNQDQSTTFQIIDVGAYGSSDYSVYINNFNYNASGQLDGFLLGNLCVEGAQTLSLEFDLAYTYFLQNNTIGTDTLLIVNLDNNEILWKSGGADLATADPQGTSFIPTTNDWEAKTINLTDLLGPSVTEVNLAILNFNGFGNNLFLDNISVVLDAPLPVEIIDFWGEAKNQISHLYWETASEYHVSHYQVERSGDGINFEFIAQVGGKGNSDLGHTYFYQDENPLNGDNYYRLTAIDYDGSENKSDNLVVLSQDIISAPASFFPNPTLGGLNIQNGSDEFLEVTIINLRQQIITSLEVPENDRKMIDLSGLPSGTYFIRYIYQHRTYSEKVVKI